MSRRGRGKTFWFFSSRMQLYHSWTSTPVPMPTLPSVWNRYYVRNTFEEQHPKMSPWDFSSKLADEETLFGYLLFWSESYDSDLYVSVVSLEFNLIKVEKKTSLISVWKQAYLNSFLSLFFFLRMSLRPAGLPVLWTLQHIRQGHGLQDPADGRGPGQDVCGLQGPRPLHGHQQHHPWHA